MIFAPSCVVSSVGRRCDVRIQQVTDVAHGFRFGFISFKPVEQPKCPGPNHVPTGFLRLLLAQILRAPPLHPVQRPCLGLLPQNHAGFFYPASSAPPSPGLARAAPPYRFLASPCAAVARPCTTFDWPHLLPTLYRRPHPRRFFASAPPDSPRTHGSLFSVPAPSLRLSKHVLRLFDDVRLVAETMKQLAKLFMKLYLSCQSMHGVGHRHKTSQPCCPFI